MYKKLIFVIFMLLLLANLVLAHPDNSEIAPQSFSSKHLISLFTVGGRPHNKDMTRKARILVNRGYVVGYSEDRRNPLWSAYRASKFIDTPKPHRYERAKFFFSDSRSASSVSGGTFGGGFDRGHMTPNFVIASQYGSLAQLETFFMTNMCPQKDDLNRGPWQRLEKFVVDAAQKRDHIFVISGPIFGDNPSITQNGADRKIQIPEAFFMILVDTDREFQTHPVVKMIAYRFPQDTPRNADFTDRSKFAVSVNDIEKETKLDFFSDFNQVFNNWEDKENIKEMEHWTNN